VKDTSVPGSAQRTLPNLSHQCGHPVNSGKSGPDLRGDQLRSTETGVHIKEASGFVAHAG
jgi:hypothetical protein